MYKAALLAVLQEKFLSLPFVLSCSIMSTEPEE